MSSGTITSGAAAPSAAPGAAGAGPGAAAALGENGGRNRNNGPPNYHRLERLGKGSFATVRACMRACVRVFVWSIPVPGLLIESIHGDADADANRGGLFWF